MELRIALPAHAPGPGAHAGAASRYVEAGLSGGANTSRAARAARAALRRFAA